MDDKKVSKGQSVKKSWSIYSKEGIKLDFLPVFEVNKDNGEVETRYLKLNFKDTKTKKEQEFTFNWLDIYMFVYFTSNEELRQNLASRYERKVNYIPYDVTFKLTDEEKASGVIKKRIELPVDELQMAIARNEAFKMIKKGKIKNDPSSFIYKGKK